MKFQLLLLPVKRHYLILGGVSLGNRMNLLAGFEMYGNEWRFKDLKFHLTTAHAI